MYGKAAKAVKKTIIHTIFLYVWAVAGMVVLGGCTEEKDTAQTQQAETVRTVTDCYGRTVQIPQQIKRVLCVGTGALRMLAYLQAEDLLAGIEDTDTQYAKDPKRDYAYVLHDKIKDLPRIGKGGGSAYTAYPEAVLQAKPDVIFSCYTREGTEQLARDTGIPVVGVRYKSIGFADASFYVSLRLMASVVGKEQRAETLLAYIDRCKADLAARARNRSEQTVYVGAVSYNGSHGFSGTYSQFGPFAAVFAQNMADDNNREGFYEADLEQVLVWNPDIIFLDPSNMHIVRKEYAVRPAFFAKLGAVLAGRVFTMPSFNNYSTNITYCLINGYWTGSLLYPEAFADMRLEYKADEILRLFLGRPYFSEMEKLGLYYGKIRLGG